MFLKQVLTFLQSSSSSNDFYKAGGEIASGIFKIVIGTSTGGAGSNPFSGIGSPEALKHNLSGYWSRRITLEHRLVYRMREGQIRVLQCRYHY